MSSLSVQQRLWASRRRGNRGCRFAFDFEGSNREQPAETADAAVAGSKMKPAVTDRPVEA